MLNVTMNATISLPPQLRRSPEGVFPLLDRGPAAQLSVPVTVNVRCGRSVHNFTATFGQTKSSR